MHWPTPQMAPALGIVAALICGSWMWSSHQPIVVAAPVTIALGAVVYVLVRRFGREPNG